MNPYKSAWYANTLEIIPEPVAKDIIKRSGLQEGESKSGTKLLHQAGTNYAQQAALGALYVAAGHAATSQIVGKAGIALRVGGRIGLRVIPIVGAVLLVYDIYQLGKYLLED